MLFSAALEREDTEGGDNDWFTYGGTDGWTDAQAAGRMDGDAACLVRSFGTKTRLIGDILSTS